MSNDKGDDGRINGNRATRAIRGVQHYGSMATKVGVGAMNQRQLGEVKAKERAGRD